MNCPVTLALMIMAIAEYGFPRYDANATAEEQGHGALFIS